MCVSLSCVFNADCQLSESLCVSRAVLYTLCPFMYFVLDFLFHERGWSWWCQSLDDVTLNPSYVPLDHHPVCVSSRFTCIFIAPSLMMMPQNPHMTCLTSEENEDLFRHWISSSFCGSCDYIRISFRFASRERMSLLRLLESKMYVHGCP